MLDKKSFVTLLFAVSSALLHVTSGNNAENVTERQNDMIRQYINATRAWMNCSTVELAQYCFELHRNISWGDTMEYCSSLGLQLLATPSDSEWHVIQDMLSLDGEAKALSERAVLFFLGLEVGVVSP